jgi:hypothetical protein
MILTIQQTILLIKTNDSDSVTGTVNYTNNDIDHTDTEYNIDKLLC